MKNKITVREWIEKFKRGDFDSKDRNIQIEAGWYDWFCSDEALTGRLKKMGNIIKDIKNDYVLDNYSLSFKNHCPLSGPLYDSFNFGPISNESGESKEREYFGVACDSKYEAIKYAVITARNGYTTEFKATNKKDLIQIIDRLGRDFIESEIIKGDK